MNSAMNLASRSALVGVVLVAGARPAALAQEPRMHALSLQQSSHSLPAGAPSAIVVVPSRWRPPTRPSLVVFLHGWQGCSAVLAGSGQVACKPGDRPQRGWGLAAQHAGSDSVAWLIVPQLAWRARDGQPGRFADAGFVRLWLNEVLHHEALPNTDSSVTTSSSLTLVAHSAGFESAAAWLRDESIAASVQQVVLLDALYAQEDAFADWLVGAAPRGGRLLSVVCGHGETWRRSERLAQQVAARLGRPPATWTTLDQLHTVFRSQPLSLVSTRIAHGVLPRRLWRPLMRAISVTTAP